LAKLSTIDGVLKHYYLFGPSISYEENEVL